MNSHGEHLIKAMLQSHSEVGIGSILAAVYPLYSKLYLPNVVDVARSKRQIKEVRGQAIRFFTAQLCNADKKMHY